MRRSLLRSAPLPALALGLGVAGCATAMAPPRVAVLDVGPVSAGLLDQQVRPVLCVTHPNPRSLRFARATFALDVAGARSAEGQTTAVDLPPLASVPIPLAVTTKTRNLASQRASAVISGGVDYRVSGHATLAGLPIGIPVDSAGRRSFDRVIHQLAACSGGAFPVACGAPQERTS